MAVTIAINVVLGSLTVALRLPLYLDSIGTILVGALAGPWAGALTGVLSNLLWSFLPTRAGPVPSLPSRSRRGGHRPDGRLLGVAGRLPVRSATVGSATCLPSRPAWAWPCSAS